MIGIGIGIPFRRMGGGGAANTARTQAFLTATGITDATIISALNAMDNSLISAGLLPSGTGAGKIKALYPIVGGTAATHKFNFVNPLDTDAAFRLTFFGGWTHSANGALPNGTNAYMNSHLIQSSDLSQDSVHFSVYYNIDSTSTLSGFEGARTSGNLIMGMFPNFPKLLGYISRAVNPTLPNYSKMNGIKIVSRNSSTNIQQLSGGLYTNDAIDSVDMATVEFYFAARNLNGVADSFSSIIRCFQTIGTGLTQLEMTTMESLIQSFNTTLGRQVSY
jgi:hypothetical protein